MASTGDDKRDITYDTEKIQAPPKEGVELLEEAPLSVGVGKGMSLYTNIRYVDNQRQRSIARSAVSQLRARASMISRPSESHQLPVSILHGCQKHRVSNSPLLAR